MGSVPVCRVPFVAPPLILVCAGTQAPTASELKVMVDESLAEKDADRRFRQLLGIAIIKEWCGKVKDGEDPSVAAEQLADAPSLMAPQRALTRSSVPSNMAVHDLRRRRPKGEAASNCQPAPTLENRSVTSTASPPGCGITDSSIFHLVRNSILPGDPRALCHWKLCGG